MEEVIIEVLPFVFLFGILGGFCLATVFNLLARLISSTTSLFHKF